MYPVFFSSYIITHLLFGSLGRNLAQDYRVPFLLDGRLDPIGSHRTDRRVFYTLDNQTHVRSQLLDLVELGDHSNRHAHLGIHLGHQESIRLQVLSRKIKLHLSDRS